MDASYEGGAITLRANKYRALMTINLPRLTLAIVSVSMLVFIHVLEPFENPLLFGNPGGVYLVSNETYRMSAFRHPPQYGSATALSILLIVTTFALLALQWCRVGGRQFTVVTGKGYRPGKLKLPNWVRRTIFCLFLLNFSLAIIIPVCQIVVNSFFSIFGFFQWETMTLDKWRNVFRDQKAVNGKRNTHVYSAAAASMVVLIGGLIGYIRMRESHWLGRYLELAAWAPWILRGIFMGLALPWAWALPLEPFNLYGTGMNIIIGFLVKGLPQGAATRQSSIHQISSEREERSRVHGRSWLKTAI